MLVCYIGPPCSGKTTAAARLFGDLKGIGYACEFIPEQARVYIAGQRLKTGSVNLTDEDQAKIMRQQGTLEWMMSKSSPKSVVIADSAAILSLLYSRENQKSEALLAFARKCVGNYDILFRCKPVNPDGLKDVNRLHSYEDALALDKELDEVLELVGIPLNKPVLLEGPAKFRASEAMHTVLTHGTVL